MKDEAVTIREAARRAYVGVETIRFYERKHLLGTIDRDASGYRRFSLADLNRIMFIKRAKKLGFSLAEIKELLDLRVDKDRTCEDVRNKAEEKMKNIEKRIRTLEEMNAALHRLTLLCSGDGPVGDCPFLYVLEHGLPLKEN